MNRTLTPQHRARGIGLVLSAMLCVSIAPTLIKVGLAAHSDPVPLLTLRLLAATIVLWIVFAIFWPGMLRIDRRGLIGCALVACANATALLCYYVALIYIDIAIAQVLFSLYPVVALTLLFLRGERFTRLSVVRLALAIVGVYLLIGPGGQVQTIGVLLVIGSATTYALYLTITQWRLYEYAPQTIAVYVVSLMALLLIGVYALRFRTWQPFSLVGWGVILVTGIVSTAIARLAMFAGIQRIGSGQTALLAPVEMLMAVLWAMLFLGERLSPLQWVGGMFILVSMALAVRRGPRK